MIIISPILKIPCELEKEITVIDLALPGTAELISLLNRMISDVSDNRDIKIELDEARRELILQALLGLTLAEAENVIARSLVKNGKLNGDCIEIILSGKSR